MTGHPQLGHLSFLLGILALLSLAISTQAANSSFAATATISPIPTQISGDSQYSLLGCYIEPPPTASPRVLGPPGTYFQPLSLDTTTFTVEKCLGACAAALAPSGTGNYTYAGIENSKECYCSLDFASNLTHAVNLGYCTSPCAGNVTEACGGYGYMSTYQLKSTLPNTTNNSTTTASPSHTSELSPSGTAVPTSSTHLSGGAIAGIVIGSIIGATLVICLIFACFKRQRKRKHGNAHLVALTQNNPHLGISQAPAPLPNTGQPSPTSTHDTRRHGMVIPSTSPHPWEVRDPNLTPASGVSPEGTNLPAPALQPHRASVSPSELDSATATMISSPADEPTLLEGFENLPASGGAADTMMSWKAGDDAGFLPDVKKKEERRGRVELPAEDRTVNAVREKSISGSDDSPVLGRRGPLDFGGGGENGASATGGWSPREVAARRQKEKLLTPEAC